MAYKITLKKSLIGTNIKQKMNLQSLGLYKIGQSVERPENIAVDGMIFKVKHLVEVKKV